MSHQSTGNSRSSNFDYNGIQSNQEASQFNVQQNYLNPTTHHHQQFHGNMTQVPSPIPTNFYQYMSSNISQKQQIQSNNIENVTVFEKIAGDFVEKRIHR
jgi:hypothetical protein